MPIHIYYVYQYAQCISISSPHWILDATTAIPKPTKVWDFTGAGNLFTGHCYPAGTPRFSWAR